MLHLLIVEDRAEICAVLVDALQGHCGVRVTTVPSAEAALALLPVDPPDLALVDAMLPKMTGLALAEHLCGRGVPVLIMTGAPELLDDFAAIGLRHLAKPFHLHDVYAEIGLLLADPEASRISLAAGLERLQHITRNRHRHDASSGAAAE